MIYFRDDIFGVTSDLELFRRNPRHVETDSSISTQSPSASVPTSPRTRAKPPNASETSSSSSAAKTARRQRCPYLHSPANDTSRALAVKVRPYIARSSAPAEWDTGVLSTQTNYDGPAIDNKHIDVAVQTDAQSSYNTQSTAPQSELYDSAILCLPVIDSPFMT